MSATMPTAEAASGGGVAGALEGTATMSPGIPLGTTGCVSSSYTLSVNAAVARGLIDAATSVHAMAGADEMAMTLSGSGTECGGQGSGTAVATCTTTQSFGGDVDPTGVDDVLTPAPAGCALAGTMTRVGALAVFALQGSFTIADPSSATDPSEPPNRVVAAGLEAVALYTPTGTTPCAAGSCANQAVAAGTVSGTVVVPPTPANTLDAVGAVAFKGTGQLSTFPCAPPPSGPGPCPGTFTGDSTGELSGNSGGSVYALTWLAPPGSINASFTYSEFQCTGLETVVGFASGTGTAYAAPGQVQGKWLVPGEQFPRDITSASGAFSFTWARAGTASALTLQSITVTVDVSGLGPQTVITQPQSGVAAFAATQTDPVNGPPLCATPLTNVQGDVAGALTLTQLHV